jgi:phospholipid/cholesterol/gamma-HCH transport system permease protein
VRYITEQATKPFIMAARAAESTARHAAALGTLAWEVAGAILAGRVQLRHVLEQAYSMGAQTMPLVLITGILSGVVTTQQGGYQFTGSIPLWVIGSVVASSIILELGPVMTAFVVIGRVGARITAEIGTMQVSEQIDALHSLGRDPVRVLAAPRMIAGVVVMPMLVALANAAGMLAGLAAANISLGLGPESFMYGARLYFHLWDMAYSMMKATAFGFIIPLISVHMGFATRGGAEGVGRATTAAVVFMIITVLFLDAMFPPLFLG